MLNPVKDFGQERHFSHRCKEKIQITLMCQCPCGQLNLFFLLVSHFENRRTSLAGAKLTLLEFLFSTGLAHSTLVKIKCMSLSLKPKSQSKGKIMNQTIQLPHAPVVLGQGI